MRNDRDSAGPASSTGIGVRGTVGGRRLALGNTALMTQIGVAVDALTAPAQALRGIAALAMSLSSVSVISNALRHRKCGPGKPAA